MSHLIMISQHACKLPTRHRVEGHYPGEIVGRRKPRGGGPLADRNPAVGNGWAHQSSSSPRAAWAMALRRIEDSGTAASRDRRAGSEQQAWPRRDGRKSFLFIRLLRPQFSNIMDHNGHCIFQYHKIRPELKSTGYYFI